MWLSKLFPNQRFVHLVIKVLTCHLPCLVLRLRFSWNAEVFVGCNFVMLVLDKPIVSLSFFLDLRIDIIMINCLCSLVDDYVNCN